MSCAQPTITRSDEECAGIAAQRQATLQLPKRWQSQAAATISGTLLHDLPVQILGLAKYRESSTIQQHCNLNLHCIQVCVTVTRFYISESVIQDTASSVQISSTQSQMRIARLQSEFVCWLQTQRWLKGML